MAMHAVVEQSHEFFMCKMRELSKALYGPHWRPKTERETYCYGLTRDSVQPDIVSSKLPGCRTAVTWLRPDLTYRRIAMALCFTANILSYYNMRKRAPGIFFFLFCFQRPFAQTAQKRTTRPECPVYHYRERSFKTRSNDSILVKIN